MYITKNKSSWFPGSKYSATLCTHFEKPACQHISFYHSYQTSTDALVSNIQQLRRCGHSLQAHWILFYMYVHCSSKFFKNFHHLSKFCGLLARLLYCNTFILNLTLILEAQCQASKEQHTTNVMDNRVQIV